MEHLGMTTATLGMYNNPKHCKMLSDVQKPQ